MIYYTEYEAARVRFYNRFIRRSRVMMRFFRRGSGYQRTRYFHRCMVCPTAPLPRETLSFK